MATNSKVFVSPGVYTSERDLSFVTQSVGVTTLGIVGEALKGPAFEPIFINSYDVYTTYFGGTDPEKFVNTQIPKYEAAYIAKAYLQQSNQMYMTRILGLSGYDAGPSWSIQTIANVDSTTVGFDQVCVQTTDYPGGLCLTNCTPITSGFSFTFSGCAGDANSITFLENLPAEIADKLTNQYTKFNGGISTLQTDLNNQLLSVFANNSLSGTNANYWGTILGADYDSIVGGGLTGVTNVLGVPSVSSDLTDYTSPFNDAWYYSLFDNYSNNSYSGYSFYTAVNDLTLLNPNYLYPNCAGFYSYEASGITANINYNTNTVEIVFPSSANSSMFSALTVSFSACTNNITVGGNPTSSGSTVLDFTSGTPYGSSGYCLTYELISSNSAVTETWNVCVTLQNPCDAVISGNTGSIYPGPADTICYSGTMEGTLYYYSGTSYSDYNNLVVATLRSRGISEFNSTSDGPIYEINELSAVTLDFTGTYAAVMQNPYAEFGINAINKNGKNFVFKTSLSTSDAYYMGKVFGLSNFSKPRTETPLFLEEGFLSMLNWAYKKGYIRGLREELISLPGARSNDSSSIGFYGEKYQTPQSPWVVSELRGNNVYKLFRFISIADGNSANDQIKISIVNMSFNNMTFDVLIRDFYDTDDSPVVLEKYTNCSMDITQNSFIARKIGSIDGDYAMVSKYVMIEMNEDAPIDALPCGFEGYSFRNYDGINSPFPIYKTKYDYPGEVVFDPPFGYNNGTDNSIVSAGDNVRRTYLGISSSVGYDLDFYQYVGKQNVGTTCDPILQDWSYITKGFHMDSGATTVLIPSGYTTSGQTAYFVGAGSFSTEPMDSSNPYYYLYSRKFTLLVAGGFDGWDVYREYRTNSDSFRLGSTGYLKGACPTDRYPSATGSGAFKRITVGNNTQDWANTDYYAYLLGQQTMSNPEAVNINVFVTPGIDYVNNSNLVEDAIDMIEYNRADSLYICTTPDYNMFVPSTTNSSTDLIYPQEAVDNLQQTGIDSNYSATYYPWVLTLDTVNNTQVYIPATAEVTRNLALTDNVAFPWFASAGYTRGIVNSVKARRKLTQEDRDTLYVGRINPIATFSDVNTVIWGNKTLQIADTALNRINVRRLLLQARKLISAVSVRLLFEQNDDKVRQDFLDAVNPILDAIRRDRGLYDFRVTVSNDPADLDRNQMNGKIYIKPTKSLEFIDIEFLITPTGASFENI